jgi:hypothetical protein
MSENNSEETLAPPRVSVEDPGAHELSEYNKIYVPPKYNHKTYTGLSA